MLIAPETFTGHDQPAAALAGDATKHAAKQPAMVRRRNHLAIFISVIGKSYLGPS